MIHKQRAFPPLDYICQIYGYGRVSHTNQMDKGQSIPDQEARITAYVQLRQLDDKGTFAACHWAGMFSEPRAQSAFSKPFRQRPTGSQLMELLNPGDHLVVDKLDRLIRAAEDFFSLNRYFAERGMRLHIVNLGGASLDTGTALGHLILGNMALYAEFESLMKGERVSEARARRRAEHTDAGVTLPVFCYLEGLPEGRERGSGAKRVFKDWAIPFFERLQYLREVDGLRFGAIRKIITTEHPDPDVRRLDYQLFEKAYWFWKAWNAAGRPDLNELKFTSFTQEYKQRMQNQPPESSDEDH